MYLSNDEKLQISSLSRPYKRDDGLTGLLVLCVRLGHLTPRIRGICDLQLPHPITAKHPRSLQYDSPVRTHHTLRIPNVNLALSVGSCLDCLSPSISNVKNCRYFHDKPSMTCATTNICLTDSVNNDSLSIDSINHADALIRHSAQDHSLRYSLVTELLVPCGTRTVPCIQNELSVSFWCVW